MDVKFFVPHPAMRPYVIGYFHTKLRIEDPCLPLDIHPIGHSAMAFVLNEQPIIRGIKSGMDYNFRFSFTGHVCKHFAFKPLTSFISIVVAAFTPIGAYQLFGVSQHSMINQSLPVDQILSGTQHVHHQLEDHASDVGKVKNILEGWLLKQKVDREKRHIKQLDYACQLIKSSSGTMRIHELCNQVGMSQTSLEDHFREKIGLSPKLYSRIVRFIKVNHFIQNKASISWDELVYRFGYFDQAHFIKEFKTFFGYSPSKIHLSSQNLTKGLSHKLGFS